MEKHWIEKALVSPIFKGGDKTLVTAFLNRGSVRLRNKKSNVLIASQGDVCEEVVMLVEGSVYTKMTSNDGNEIVVIEELTGPAILAPAFTYADDNHLPVDIITLSECALIYIDRCSFADLLHQDSQLMMNFIMLLSNRCSKLAQKVHQFALLSLKNRVLEYLNKNKSFKSVQWLSRVLGVARPALSRVLAQLTSDGVITKVGNGYELIN